MGRTWDDTGRLVNGPRNAGQPKTATFNRAQVDGQYLRGELRPGLS